MVRVTWLRGRELKVVILTLVVPVLKEKVKIGYLV